MRWRFSAVCVCVCVVSCTTLSHATINRWMAFDCQWIYIWLIPTNDISHILRIPAPTHRHTIRAPCYRLQATHLSECLHSYLLLHMRWECVRTPYNSSMFLYWSSTRDSHSICLLRSVSELLSPLLPPGPEHGHINNFLCKLIFLCSILMRKWKREREPASRREASVWWDVAMVLVVHQSTRLGSNSCKYATTSNGMFRHHSKTIETHSKATSTRNKIRFSYLQFSETAIFIRFMY